MFYEVLIVILTACILVFYYFLLSKRGKSNLHSRTIITNSNSTPSNAKYVTFTENVDIKADVEVEAEVNEVSVDAAQVEETNNEANDANVTEGYLTTRAEFVATENDEEIDFNLEDLINEFIEYVRVKKVIKLDELSMRMRSEKDEVVNKLRELEGHGQTFGFVDRTGKYINLNVKELELLEKLVIQGKKKKFKKSEILEEFSKITGNTTTSTNIKTI